MSPSPIKVNKDKFGNELAVDRPMHDEATAQMGDWNFGGNQYDDSPGKGGYGSYGSKVTDLGQSPKVERTSVNVGRAERGKE
jgi:hypothetical protein